MSKFSINSSVVSIVPFPIHEEKPGIYPGVFDIKKCENGIPEILIVGESIHYIEVDIGRRVPVTNPSARVAESIVFDYVNSQIGVSPESGNNAGPGIFWVPGEATLSDIIKDYQEELEAAKERQNNWFIAMIKEADDDWERYRQHRTITDMQRYAAKSLQYDRPWVVKAPDLPVEMIKCPACSNEVLSGSIICNNCKCVLNVEKYKTLQFA